MKTTPKHIIEVYVKNGGWCIYDSNPATSLLFGTHEIPTCYKATLKAERILERVKKYYPNHDVMLA